VEVPQPIEWTEADDLASQPSPPSASPAPANPASPPPVAH
jgi:hypothetical protein